MEAADDLSQFSDGSIVIRNWTNGFDWHLNNHKSLLTNRASGYNQLTNKYTFPELNNVSYEFLYFDIDVELINA